METIQYKRWKMLIQKGYPVPLELDSIILDMMAETEEPREYYVELEDCEEEDIYCLSCGKFLGHYSQEQMMDYYDLSMSGACYIPLGYHDNCSSKYEQYTKIKGIFKPKNKETLREEAKEFIGRPLKFRALWIIEDGDYKGQWAFRPMTMDEKEVSMGWVPQEDIIEYHRF